MAYSKLMQVTYFSVSVKNLIMMPQWANYISNQLYEYTQGRFLTFNYGSWLQEIESLQLQDMYTLFQPSILLGVTAILAGW